MQSNDAKCKAKVYKNDFKSDLKHSKLFAIFMELNNNKYYENFDNVIKLIIMAGKKCVECIIYNI